MGFPSTSTASKSGAGPRSLLCFFKALELESGLDPERHFHARESDAADVPLEVRRLLARLPVGSHHAKLGGRHALSKGDDCLRLEDRAFGEVFGGKIDCPRVAGFHREAHDELIPYPASRPDALRGAAHEQRLAAHHG